MSNGVVSPPAIPQAGGRTTGSALIWRELAAEGRHCEIVKSFGGARALTIGAAWLIFVLGGNTAAAASGRTPARPARRIAETSPQPPPLGLGGRATNP